MSKRHGKDIINIDSSNDDFESDIIDGHENASDSKSNICAVKNKFIVSIYI